MPQWTPPVWLDVPGSPALLQALLDVPPPCPPRDGGDGGALVTLSLVRAWGSTDAALRATLRRRIARAHALADALTAGRHPTRAELRAWIVGDDATQLAFPELLVNTVTRDWSALSEAVARHVGGLRRALAVLAESDGRNDDTRCAIIRDIREQKFWPPASLCDFAEDVAAICQDRRLGHARLGGLNLGGEGDAA